MLSQLRSWTASLARLDPAVRWLDLLGLLGPEGGSVACFVNRPLTLCCGRCRITWERHGDADADADSESRDDATEQRILTVNFCDISGHTGPWSKSHAGRGNKWPVQSARGS